MQTALECQRARGRFAGPEELKPWGLEKHGSTRTQVHSCFQVGTTSSVEHMLGRHEDSASQPCRPTAFLPRIALPLGVQSIIEPAGALASRSSHDLDAAA